MDRALENGLVWKSPQHAQQICQIFHASATPALCQSLQLGLRGGQGLWVEQVAKRHTLATAEKLSQQSGVEGQGSSAPLGKGRVTLVQELCDVTEHQASGER